MILSIGACGEVAGVTVTVTVLTVGVVEDGAGIAVTFTA